MIAKQLRDGGDGGVGALHQRMAMLCVIDGGRQDFAQRDGAVIAQQQHPGLECAGDARGKQSGPGHEIEAQVAIVRNRRAGRRRTLAADDFRLAAAGIVDNHRNIAARTIQMRLDHLQGESGRDRGVKGVAAFLQDRHPHCRGNPVRRGDDAERAFDFRAGSERVGVNNAHA